MHLRPTATASALILLIAFLPAAALTTAGVSEKTGRLPGITGITRPLSSTKQTSSDRLIKRHSFNAEDLCDGIGEIRNKQFLQSRSSWECTAFFEINGEADPSSIFLQAKGETTDSISSFRLKINLTRISAGEPLLSIAIELIDRFPLGLSDTSRSYIRKKLRSLQSFRALLENYEAEFASERSDQDRYNLLIKSTAMRTTACEPTPDATLSQRLLLAFSISCIPLGNSPPPLEQQAPVPP